MVAEDANPFPGMLGEKGTKVSGPHGVQDLCSKAAPGKTGIFAQFSWGHGWETHL